MTSVERYGAWLYFDMDKIGLRLEHNNTQIIASNK